MSQTRFLIKPRSLILTAAYVRHIGGPRCVPRLQFHLLEQVHQVGTTDTGLGTAVVNIYDLRHQYNHWCHDFCILECE